MDILSKMIYNSLYHGSKQKYKSLKRKRRREDKKKDKEKKSCQSK